MSKENSVKENSVEKNIVHPSFTHHSVLSTHHFSYADLLGKEFKYGARGPDAYDCYGLMIECRRRAGLFVPEEYASTDLPEVMHDSLEHVRVNYPFMLLRGPQPFSFVTFKLHPRYTTHIGMVLPDGYNVRFIHILPKMRVGIERLDSPAWAHRITGFWETELTAEGAENAEDVR